MSRIGTESVVDDRTCRNLSQGGFGNMATKEFLLAAKVDKDLFLRFKNYAEKNEETTGTLMRKALRSFLDTKESPMNVKKMKSAK